MKRFRSEEIDHKESINKSFMWRAKQKVSEAWKEMVMSIHRNTLTFVDNDQEMRLTEK